MLKILLLEFGIVAPKTAKDKEISALFMSQTGSDVAFKIDEKVVPAHKEILMKKSRYFEGLLKSGMAESTQEIIEIKDCEYEIFKEYLRWIYQEEVEIKNEDSAIKLYTLGDEYLQKNLGEKCLSFLNQKLNRSNIYTVLGFAHKENIALLKNRCMMYFNVENIAGLIEYLADHQENSELRNFAFNFVLNNFFEIHENEKGEMKIYEDFLIKNIGVNTISPIARFLARENDDPLEKINFYIGGARLGCFAWDSLVIFHLNSNKKNLTQPWIKLTQILRDCLGRKEVV